MKAYTAIICLLSVVSVHCAPSSAREGKTLGLAVTAANAGLGLAGGVASTAVKVGGGLLAAKLAAKPIILGLGAKYLLFKHLASKNGGNGLHFGGSAGLGIGGGANGGSQGQFAAGQSASSYVPAEPQIIQSYSSEPQIIQPYVSEPQIVSEISAPVSYDVVSSPGVVQESSFVSAPAVFSQQDFISTAPIVSQPTFVSGPVVAFDSSAPVVSQNSFVSGPVVAFDNVDEYGAPSAPLLTSF